MDLQDIEHELNLISNLQSIQDDFYFEMRQSRNRNDDNGFSIDYDYFKDKQDALSFVINEHINSAQRAVKKLVKKEMGK